MTGSDPAGGEPSDGRSPGIRRARPGDFDALVALLDANDLPVRDVEPDAGTFFVVREGGRVVAGGGVEAYGDTGLVRSLVVEESRRGRGYGTAVCDELERYAGTEGVEMLYLLTTTAAAFFHERGYDTVDRDSVPARIRSTAEFAELCPTSATCLCGKVGNLG